MVKQLITTYLLFHTLQIISSFKTQNNILMKQSKRTLKGMKTARTTRLLTKTAQQNCDGGQNGCCQYPPTYYYYSNGYYYYYY